MSIEKIVLGCVDSRGPPYPAEASISVAQYVALTFWHRAKNYKFLKTLVGLAEFLRPVVPNVAQPSPTGYVGGLTVHIGEVTWLYHRAVVSTIEIPCTAVATGRSGLAFSRVRPILNVAFTQTLTNGRRRLWLNGRSDQQCEKESR